MADYPVDSWRKVVSVNLDGVFYCMRAAIPRMIACGGGSIVNIASIASTVAIPTIAPYVASKHGVLGLTRAAALEYADQGIRVNAVGPGFIETPLIGHIPEQELGQFRALHPLGRLGRADEVAELVAYLASDRASFSTGGYHTVDGGYLAQ
jgi:NAD(P)-dependent dehydrogenase (short-subunit alcohol dehydrogenase family)